MVKVLMIILILIVIFYIVNTKEKFTEYASLESKFFGNLLDNSTNDLVLDNSTSLNSIHKYFDEIYVITLPERKKYIIEIIKMGKNYGSNISIKKKYNIEFVSANPTGPLHVGHCRGAILGDALSNLLKFNGHDIVKEYYVNDCGNQIKNFTLSVYYRVNQILNYKVFPLDKNLYPGDYIIDIAKEVVKKKIISNYENFDSVFELLKKESLNFSMNLIRDDLSRLGVKHDSFMYESDFVANNTIFKIIKKLEKGNHVYYGTLESPRGEIQKEKEKGKQLLFRSTEFGDDLDRVLKKNDESWTYFATDIAYHENKITRNFDFLINVLGADHAGYTKRISSAVKALSKNKISLICKICQLVKLFKNGQPFKMSKRQGDYITVNNLLNEVGKDSVRFIMLNRSNDAELDFDFEKVREKSKDNPVFYVQYAYARVKSIFRTLNLNINDKIELGNDDFSLNNYEIQILKKISEWPKCVEISIDRLEPHRIPYYLYELATLFHSYWNMGSKNKALRFVGENKIINKSRLLILQALSIVINNAMLILGVSTPEKM